jgi:hypothetical protein
MEPSYLVISGLVGAVFLGVWLLRKFPRLKLYLPYIAWLARLASRTISYWKFKKVYKDKADLVYKYSVLLNLVAFSGDSKKSKEWVSKFVTDTYRDLFQYSGKEDEAVRLSSAVWVMLTKYPDIIETLKGLSDTKDLDVKKATMVAIDVLGELVDMSNKIDVLFYQSIVYGINKALLEVKNSSNDKERLAKVSATLWRIYQLTLAYKNQHSLVGLTREQFYSQVGDVLKSMYSQFSK